MRERLFILPPALLAGLKVERGDATFFSPEPELKPDKDEAEIFRDARRRAYPIGLPIYPLFCARLRVERVEIPVVRAKIYIAAREGRRGEEALRTRAEKRLVAPRDRAVLLIERP